MTARYIAVGAGVVTAFLVGLAVLSESSYDRAVMNATDFCNKLIPKLEAYRSERGSYPEKIDSAWYSRPMPDLIRESDFYVPAQDGKEYLLRFRDPRVDPRFWFRDVYGYSSREGRWQRYDGY